MLLQGSSRSTTAGSGACARERDALLLAAGELVRVAVAVLGQADEGERLGDTHPDLHGGP